MTIGRLVQCGSSFRRTLQCIGAKLRHFWSMTVNATNSPVIGNVKTKDRQLSIRPPSSLLEASFVRELEHNCREERITFFICIEKQFWTNNENFPLFLSGFPASGKEVVFCLEKIAFFWSLKVGLIWQQTLHIETILLNALPCHSIQYHAISNTTQYHTIQGNLTKHIFVWEYDNHDRSKFLSTKQMTGFPTWRLTFKVINWIWDPFLTIFYFSDIWIKNDD